MKCPSCGAEANNKYCEYCGTKIEENDVVNCPKCGSKKVRFQRETTGAHKTGGSLRLGKRTRVGGANYVAEHHTIGICQSCGYTWTPNTSTNNKHSVLWWILVVLFWPISLSVWFYKTPKVKLDKKYRALILAGIWIVLIIFSYVTPSDNTKPVNNENTTAIVTTTQATKTETIV